MLSYTTRAHLFEIYLETIWNICKQSVSIWKVFESIQSYLVHMCKFCPQYMKNTWNYIFILLMHEKYVNFKQHFSHSIGKMWEIFWDVWKSYKTFVEFFTVLEKILDILCMCEKHVKLLSNSVRKKWQIFGICEFCVIFLLWLFHIVLEKCRKLIMWNSMCTITYE